MGENLLKYLKSDIDLYEKLGIVRFQSREVWLAEVVDVYVNLVVVEVSSSLLKCDACGSRQETTAISQCCSDHLVCKTCVEKQVKRVISLDSQDVNIKFNTPSSLISAWGL